MECVCLKTRSEDFSNPLRYTKGWPYKKFNEWNKSILAQSNFKHWQLLRNLLTIVKYNSDITTQNLDSYAHIGIP